jgi:hypothetical protein
MAQTNTSQGQEVENKQGHQFPTLDDGHLG